MCTVTNFNDRLNLTEQIEDRLQEYFTVNQVIIQKFGSEVLTRGCEQLSDFLCLPQANIDASAMILKFAPDLILLKRTEPQKVYFLDVKHLITPIYSNNKLNKVKQISGEDELTRSRVGEIAREALLSYRRYYPNTIVLIASQYNPKLLMAQFASDIKCLYCYRSPVNGDYDCNNCPLENGEFFDIERMTDAVGSQTPITNIDLDSFEEADNFFARLGITVLPDISTEIKELIMNEPIFFSNNIDEKTKNKVRYELNKSGCSWINYYVYSNENNPFYHIDSNCFCINQSETIVYDSVEAAKEAGKRTKCKFCTP